MSKQQSRSPLQALLDQNIRHFVDAFRDSSRHLFADAEGKLVHPGEFGAYREGVTKKFLQAFSPQRMAIDSGFVINPTGRISSQCDVVIYDRSVSPLLENEQLQRFFPAETVCAVGEVKSVISRSQLETALRKLAAIKSMRDTLWEPRYSYTVKEQGIRGEFQPEIDERDQIMTFLICESFAFDFREEAEHIFACYAAENPKYPRCLQHNMILSLKDGLVAYFHPGENVLFHASTKVTKLLDYAHGAELAAVRMAAKPMTRRFIRPEQAASVEHIRQFAKLLFLGLCSTSVLVPEVSKYLVSEEDVLFADYAP
ncbi:hypothetical protein MJ904_20680 [Massilia sp. MB5]|uniref:DUF6602 domain-containing protein n=1 Tax=Massilia sp. MB5 TaxID=2919578 RepID=UPI001F0F8305|nr:DUF6602 domain-containing protein [Massilia sp. MB5]UMR29455.1 hypothetical protein MJ904_20680 [Massilia sp. MB5]